METSGEPGNESLQLFKRKCAVDKCNNAGSMMRSGIPLCSLECVHQLSRNSAALGASPAIENSSRKRPANHGTPPDSDKDEEDLLSLEEAQNEIALLKARIVELENELPNARIAAGTNFADFLSKPKPDSFADVIKKNDVGNLEKAGLSVFLKKDLNVKDLDKILNTSNGGPVALKI